jgi:hypothetical protein
LDHGFETDRSKTGEQTDKDGQKRQADVFAEFIPFEIDFHFSLYARL